MEVKFNSANREKQIAQYRINAKNASYVLNQKTIPSEHDIKDYCCHLGDKLNHPTTAMLAMREQNCDIYSAPYNRNKKMLEEKIFSTRTIHNVAEERINDLYGKTRKIREYIIERKRVVLDRVRPSKGYNLLDRIKIFLR